MAQEPILSAAHAAGGILHEPPRALDFILKEADGWYSRDVIRIPQGDAVLLPGSFVTATGTLATTAGSIAGILCYATNPVDGIVEETVLTRLAQVVDARLQYAALDPAAVATQLKTLGIIVRAGILPNVKEASFGVDEPSTEIQSGIPPAAPAPGNNGPTPPDGNGDGAEEAAARGRTR